MCIKRRLLHSELEAVPGLAGNMAGLRFLYAHALLGCFAWCVEAARYMKYLIKGCHSEHDSIMKKTARNVMRAVFSGKSTKEVFTWLYKEAAS